MATYVTDELDLSLIHALQINPRASWATLATVLGSSPAHLQQRWQALGDAGIAWVTVSPIVTPDVTVAFAGISCAPGAVDEVSRQACRDPRVMTVEVLSSGADIMLTVLTRGRAAMSQYLLADLPALPGVTASQAHLATGIHREGSSWRLDALDTAQRAALDEGSPTVTPADPPTDHWALVSELVRDGRVSSAELARLTGRNPATTRRQVARLRAAGLFSFRCDVAAPEVGWSTASTWWARVPPVDVDRTVQVLSSMKTTRLVASITGRANLTFTVYSRGLEELHRLQRVFGERFPELEVLDVAVHLRLDKQLGRIIGRDGRATGEVVVPAVLSG